ncbi:MAG: peptidylprolyl isomerase [Silvibacterium sp.]
MAQYGLICLLLGSLSWGQALNAGPMLAGQRLTQRATAAATSTSDVSRDSGASGAAQNKPLITIEGLCKHPTATAANSNCTTVITREEFERVVNALQPGMSKRARREFAETYADALIMTSKAEQMGLDKGPNYEEQMQLARIQVLSQDLKKAILEKASQISEADIEQYYHNNIERFEKAEVERIYIPKNMASLSVSDEDITPSGGQMQAKEAMEKMKIEADDLHARALAGDDFSTLQADAYKRAGIKSAVPATTMWLRRISLPPGQSSVMDLRSGEVSPVMVDSNGYFIYRLKSKDTLSLEQARGEIIETLRSQRIQSETHNVLSTATTTVDESYFTK